LLQQVAQGEGFATAAVGLHEEPRLNERRQVQRDLVA